MTNKDFKIALDLLSTSDKYAIKFRIYKNSLFYNSFYLDCPGMTSAECMFCPFYYNQECTINEDRDTFTPNQLNILKPLYPEYFYD